MNKTGLVYVAALLAVAPVEPAMAANAPSDVCQAGQIVVMRTSTITGPRVIFDKAVADQLAWYRSHGFSDNTLIAAPVVVQNAATKDWSVSPGEVITLHLNPPKPDAVKPDAAWKAFVDEFKSSSQVTAEKTVCLPQALR